MTVSLVDEIFKLLDLLDLLPAQRAAVHLLETLSANDEVLAGENNQVARIVIAHQTALIEDHLPLGGLIDPPEHIGQPGPHGEANDGRPECVAIAVAFDPLEFVDEFGLAKRCHCYYYDLIGLTIV